MDSRSWGVEIWDQADYLIQHESDQNSLQDQHIKMLSELQRLTVDFAKRYRKIVANYMPKKKSETTELTLNQGLSNAMENIMKMGEHFEQYGNNLQVIAIAPLKIDYDNHRSIIEKTKSLYSKHTLRRDNEKKKVDNCWKLHINTFKDKIKAETLISQANKNGFISREEQQKFEIEVQSKSRAFTESQQTYASELGKFNDFQRRFYSIEMYDIVTELEMMERKRAQKMKEIYFNIASMAKRLSIGLGSASDLLRTNVSKIVENEDCKRILENHRSGFLYPVDLPFLNLTQCTQSMLDNPQQMVSLMLGSSVNTSQARVNSGKETSVFSIFEKNRSQSIDGHGMRTAFIAGIDSRPVKEFEMTIIQINERIKLFQRNQSKCQDALKATKRLAEWYKQNPKLGDAIEVEPSIGKYSRQLLSLSEHINRLQSLYQNMGGDQALAQMRSSLEVSNPSANETASSGNVAVPSRVSRPLNGPTRPESSGVDSDSDPDSEDSGSTLNYVGVEKCKYDFEGLGSAKENCRMFTTTTERHFVYELPPRGSGTRRKRKRCIRCYTKHKNISGREVAMKKAKQVSTFCSVCVGQPALCLKCFSATHYYQKNERY